MQFDFSEVNRLAADLGNVPKRVMPNVRKAVEVTARNIKDDWRSDARRKNPVHARAYPAAVSYDMEETNGVGVSAEIGPELGGQGSLGILEDASGGVTAAPQRSGKRAEEKNRDDFVKGLTIAAGDVL